MPLLHIFSHTNCKVAARSEAEQTTLKGTYECLFQTEVRGVSLLPEKEPNALLSWSCLISILSDMLNFVGACCLLKCIPLFYSVWYTKTIDRDRFEILC